MACDAAEPIHPASHVVTPLFDDCGLRAFLTEVRNGSPSSQVHVTVLSCLFTLYTAVMSFEILFPFGLWVFEPDWLLNHSQLV